MMHIQGILLAAGLGRRFQADNNPAADKLLASVTGDAESILLRSALVLKQALPHSLAVIQPQHTARKKVLDALSLTVVESGAAKNGMGDSIRIGVEASAQADGYKRMVG